MRKIIITFVFFILCVSAVFGQQTEVRRIKIRHADPALIAMILGGTADINTPPEMSTTIFGVSMGHGVGGGTFGGGFGQSGFGGSSSGGGFGGVSGGGR